MSFYNSKITKPMGKAKVVMQEGVSDPELLSLLQGYRRSVSSTYTPVLPGDMRDELPKGELYVSKKIDGELWFLILDGKDTVLANSMGKVIFGDFPVLNEAKSSAKKCQRRTVIAGELYADNEKNRSRASDLASAMGGGTKAKVDSIKFIAFDLLQGGQEDFLSDQYPEKLKFLNSLFGGNNSLTVIETKTVNSSKEVHSFFEEWVEKDKQEGLVVRSAAGRTFKIKPSFSIDAAVIGYTERSEDNTQVRSIALALMREDGIFQWLGSCGNLGSEKDRKAIMKDLQKSQVDSLWRLSSNNGAMYRFVKPTLVVEIKATDIQSEDSGGNPIQKMALSFDESGWSGIGKSNFASLMHPVLLRTRTDKEVNETDIRVSQISDLCYLEEKGAKKDSSALPESKVLQRKVYIKKTKDSMAIRKLVVWQTNKEKVNSDFPGFVVHWTDYSPGRKSPITRQVRLAPDKKTAFSLADSILSVNIKKGWELVDSN